MTIEDKLASLGLELPPAPAPKGVYKPALIVDHFLYMSGHGPVKSDGSLIIGKVGVDLNIEEGKLAARQVGLTMLASIKANLGDFTKIKRIVKVFGMVNAPAGFGPHPFVINGFSELMMDLWGPENGVGVRSAVGMGSLPDDIPVEIEAVFELEK